MRIVVSKLFPFPFDLFVSEARGRKGWVKVLRIFLRVCVCVPISNVPSPFFVPSSILTGIYPADEMDCTWTSFARWRVAFGWRFGNGSENRYRGTEALEAYIRFNRTGQLTRWRKHKVRSSGSTAGKNGKTLFEILPSPERKEWLKFTFLRAGPDQAGRMDTTFAPSWSGFKNWNMPKEMI